MTPTDLPLRKIISGGQTGVDRGALDAAIQLGLPHGGWCPRGRLAEDGVIPSEYLLTECNSAVYHIRTEQNVLVSSGTLILHRGPLTGGTALTLQFAKKHGRPFLLVNLQRPHTTDEVHQWLRTHSIEVLNVAGPRESSSPGIQLEATAFVRRVLMRDEG